MTRKMLWKNIMYVRIHINPTDATKLLLSNSRISSQAPINPHITMHLIPLHDQTWFNTPYTVLQEQGTCTYCQGHRICHSSFHTWAVAYTSPPGGELPPMRMGYWTAFPPFSLHTHTFSQENKSGQCMPDPPPLIRLGRQMPFAVWEESASAPHWDWVNKLCKAAWLLNLEKMVLLLQRKLWVLLWSDFLVSP